VFEPYSLFVLQSFLHRQKNLNGLNAAHMPPHQQPAVDQLLANNAGLTGLLLLEGYCLLMPNGN
jgi:hypothetical protein